MLDIVISLSIKYIQNLCVIACAPLNKKKYTHIQNAFIHKTRKIEQMKRVIKKNLLKNKENLKKKEILFFRKFIK